MPKARLTTRGPSSPRRPGNNFSMRESVLSFVKPRNIKNGEQETPDYVHEVPEYARHLQRRVPSRSEPANGGAGGHDQGKDHPNRQVNDMQACEGKVIH